MVFLDGGGEFRDKTPVTKDTSDTPTEEIFIKCPGEEAPIGLDTVLHATGIRFNVPSSITEEEARNLGVNWSRISPHIEDDLNDLMDQLPTDRFGIMMIALTTEDLDMELLESLVREFKIFGETLEAVGFSKED